MRDEFSLEQKLEAMLTVALEPISAEELADVVDADAADVTATLRETAHASSSSERRGFQFAELASGWVMQSSPDVAQWVDEVRQSRRVAPTEFRRPRDPRDHRLPPADLARADHRAARGERRRRVAAARAARLHRRGRSRRRAGSTDPLRHHRTLPRPHGARLARATFRRSKSSCRRSRPPIDSWTRWTSTSTKVTEVS